MIVLMYVCKCTRQRFHHAMQTAQEKEFTLIISQALERAVCLVQNQFNGLVLHYHLFSVGEIG